MRDELMSAIKLAYTMGHVADAIEAAIQAAYSNNPRHGYEAAIAVFVNADGALREEASASAPVEPLVPDAAEDADDVAEQHDA